MVTDSTTNQAQALKRTRLQLIGIMMVGFISLGGSYAVFYYAQSGASWGTTNNGAFVTPSTSTEQLGWQLEGDANYWWLWVVADLCAQDCQKTVKDLRAVHMLLNRQADRVRRSYTWLDTQVEMDWMDEFPQMTQVTVTDRTKTPPGVYIVDPNGNLVLFYPLPAEPKPILQDLKKLLKVSQIG